MITLIVLAAVAAFVLLVVARTVRMDSQPGRGLLPGAPVPVRPFRPFQQRETDLPTEGDR